MWNDLVSRVSLTLRKAQLVGTNQKSRAKQTAEVCLLVAISPWIAAAPQFWDEAVTHFYQFLDVVVALFPTDENAPQYQNSILFP